MKLKREYKEGTLISFKWYDNWRDEMVNPNNFRVLEGIIETNTVLDEVIVFNGHENKYYAVPTACIIKSF